MLVSSARVVEALVVVKSSVVVEGGQELMVGVACDKVGLSRVVLCAKFVEVEALVVNKGSVVVE